MLNNISDFHSVNIRIEAWSGPVQGQGSALQEVAMKDKHDNRTDDVMMMSYDVFDVPVYEPVKLPIVQVRVSLRQLCPQPTDEVL